MNDGISDKDEIIDLLINLLHVEQSRREAIATDFHGKKSELAVTTLYLSKIQRDIQAGKFDTESLKLPMKIFSESMDSLRQISYDIYPKIVTISGLNVGLRQLQRDFSEKFGMEISLQVEKIESSFLGKSEEVAIYWLCLDVIDYFHICKIKQLSISLAVRSSGVDISFVSKGDGVVPEQHPEKAKKIQIIKGRLVWQKARIQPQTNWTNKFYFCFDTGTR